MISMFMRRPGITAKAAGAASLVAQNMFAHFLSKPSNNSSRESSNESKNNNKINNPKGHDNSCSKPAPKCG